MLRGYFSWFISSLEQVFNIFKNTKLDNGISYLSFLVFLAFIGIVIGLINHIKDENFQRAQDERWLSNTRKYDEYKDYTSWLRRNTK